MPTPNPNSLKRTRDHRRGDIFLSVAAMPGPAGAYLGSSDFGLYFVDLSVEKPDFRSLGKHASFVTSVAVTPDAVVTGSYDTTLKWWNPEDGSEVRSVEAHAKWLRCVRASPDGKLVASTADDMVCRLWDAGTGELVRELRGHDEKTPHHFHSMLYACAFSPDGRHIATADKTGKIVVWEVDTGTLAVALEAPVMYTWDPKQRIHSIGGPRSLAFSPDGRTLAVGGMGKVGNIDHLQGKARIEAFEWRNGERTLEFESDTFKGLVEWLAFAPGGEWLAAAGGDNGGFLLFLDHAGGEGKGKVLRDEKVESHVHEAAFSDDYSRLYVAAHGRASVYEF